jgi:dihydrodipicolinate synthase/N-acetylneuraminate lyase
MRLMGTDKEKIIYGNYAAMMTPYTQEGQIDEEKLREFLGFYKANNLNGVFAVSNIGEFAALSFEEKCKIVKICGDEKEGKLKVCAGISDLNPDKSLELARYSAAHGIDAVILSSPYYYPYSKEYMETYIKEILEYSPLPVIFYNSPQFSGKIPESLLLELLYHPKVIGIKESSGDIKCLLRIIDEIKRYNLSVDVMLGWEELFLTGLMNGASGCITSLSGIVPELMNEIYVSFQNGKLEWADSCQRAVIRIAALLNSYGFIPGYKMGMAARLPYRILHGKILDRLEADIQVNVNHIRSEIQKELRILENKEKML